MVDPKENRIPSYNSDYLTDPSLQPRVVEFPFQKKKKKSITGTTIIRILFCCLLITTFVLGIIFSKKFFRFIASNFIGQNYILAFFVISGLYVVASVLLVPGSILTLLSGFLFARALGLVYGILIGTLCVSFGAVSGATAAYLLGGRLFKNWVQGKLESRKKFKILLNAMKDQGFKLVLLLRLSPILPFNLLNYLLSVTSVPLLSYISASALGMLPGTAFYVYLGATAASLTELGAGKSIGSEETILLISGGIFTLFLFLGLFFYAKRIIDQLFDQESAAHTDPESNDQTEPLLNSQISSSVNV